MSIEVMTALWKTCLYEGHSLNVLLAMADWAEDDGGDIFPGIELLAAKSRASVRTTQEVLRQMEGDGVIERIANAKGGRGKVTEYRIDLERVRELQGLHEDDCPDCSRCAAKRKSAEKRAQHRAKRAQSSDLKGAAGRQKGADRVLHIDNTRQHPSNTHHSQTPAGAGESETVASLGEATPERWKEFRSAVADTWPDGFVQADEGKARSEFDRQTRVVGADSLIACARAHGAAKTAAKARRGGTPGQFLMKLPSNWLRERGWEGYVAATLDAEQREAGRTLALARVHADLGAGVIERLKKIGMTDADLALLDGGSFEPGPPAVFTVAKSFAAQRLRDYGMRLEREFGHVLEIVVIAERRIA